MHDYTTILSVIELRFHKISYDNIQKRYRIGRNGILMIMECYRDSGLSLGDLEQMPAEKVVSPIISLDIFLHHLQE